MHRNEVLITAITIQGLSYREAAHRFGVSKSLIHKLHQRWKAEGDAAFEPQSRAPHHRPNQTPPELHARVLALRTHLSKQGSDAGADTICEYLAREGHVLSRTTIWRILTTSGAITPQPQKRPRASWQRFVARQPNEMWQSDFTHYRLSDGTEVEIIAWLDDHACFLTHLSAHPRINGPIVVDTFNTAALQHGYPASTLTDNGMVYTTRLAQGGKRAGLNGFETLLALHGITQKNGRPYKPTTQGKIERFWQTLKKYLNQQHLLTMPHLENELERFLTFYNTIRPHRALGRRTPHFAYYFIPKATPTTDGGRGIWHVRYDIVDPSGSITLRYAGKLKHLGIGGTAARLGDI